MPSTRHWFVTRFQAQDSVSMDLIVFHLPDGSGRRLWPVAGQPDRKHHKTLASGQNPIRMKKVATATDVKTGESAGQVCLAAFGVKPRQPATYTDPYPFIRLYRQHRLANAFKTSSRQRIPYTTACQPPSYQHGFSIAIGRQSVSKEPTH